MGGLTLGEDLLRDCKALRKWEDLGFYPKGHHEEACPLDHSIQQERENTK